MRSEIYSSAAVVCAVIVIWCRWPWSRGLRGIRACGRRQGKCDGARGAYEFIWGEVEV